MAEMLEFVAQMNLVYNSNLNAGKVSSEMAQIQSRMQNLQAQFANVSAYNKAKSGIQTLAQRLDAARIKNQKLADIQTFATSTSKKQNQEYQKSNEEVKKLSANYDKQIASLNELGEALKRAGFDTENFARSQENLENAIKATESAKKTLESREKILNWDNVRNTVINPAMPVIATIRPLIKASADFEAAMAQIKAVGFNAKNADLTKFYALQNQALELGASTKFTSVEAANAQEMLMRANYSPDEIIATMPALLNMASAENLGIAEAANILAGIKGGMNMQATDSSRIADILTYTSTTSKLDVPTLAQGLQQVAPIASKLGVKLEQLTAMVGVLANNNIDAGTINAQLRNMYVILNQSEKRQALISQGIKLRTREGNMVELHEIFRQMSEKWANVSETERLSRLEEIFGKMSVSVAQALMTASESGELQKYQENIFTQNQGTTQRMSDINLDTLSQQMTILQSAWEGLKISVGDIFSPVVRAGVEGLTTVISSVNNLVQSFPNAAKALTFTFTTLASAKAITGIANIGRALISWPLAIHSKHMADIAAGMSGAAKGASLFGGALTLSAGQITLIVSGLVLIIEHWKEITDWAKKAGDAIKNIDRDTPVQKLREQGNITDYHVRNLESAFAIPSLEAHAKGGIFSQPHIGLVAEAGREAIIPMQNKSRGLPLLFETARQMGVSPEILSAAGQILTPPPAIMNISSSEIQPVQNINQAMQNNSQMKNIMRPSTSVLSRNNIYTHERAIENKLPGSASAPGLTGTFLNRITNRIAGDNSSSFIRSALGNVANIFSNIGGNFRTNALMERPSNIFSPLQNAFSSIANIFTGIISQNPNSTPGFIPSSNNILNLAQDLIRTVTSERNANITSNKIYNAQKSSGNEIKITINANSENEQDLANKIAQAVRDVLSDIESLNVRTSYA